MGKYQQPPIPKGEAFGIFDIENRVNMLKGCRGKKFQTIQAFVAKKARKQWDKMSDEDKQPYEHAWEQARVRSNNRMQLHLKAGGVFWASAATEYTPGLADGTHSL